ncbi:hypothetical protein [Mesorhizobium sp. M00.F.Ca.ET.216.01.1.1]|uniref:hypothetical protein n=1 Tax=Mesorhizobium sp. M00.F.Ca.ET.216.01.1.1 TaxID=2500528 RepID=UPI001FE16DE3|nr:hypothetical protein [Mesorhizobium sp. M00.F.Ca.ET.216.01.1.1]
MGAEPVLAKDTVAWPLASAGVVPLGTNDLDLTSLRRSPQFPFRAMQETSITPDTSGEFDVAPLDALARARPAGQTRKWTAAIIISCLLHAAVATVFLIAPAGTFDLSDSNQIEGGDQPGAAVVGSASDGQSPGAMNVTLVPDPQLAKPEPQSTLIGRLGKQRRRLPCPCRKL